MKKLIIAFLFIMMGIGVYAQENKKIAIIPQVGLNFSKFANEPVEQDYHSRTGYQAGLFISTLNTVFIQPGIFFSRQGNDLYHFSELTSDNIRENVDYNVLKVPVFFGLNLWVFRVYTGPTLSVFTNVHGNQFGFENEDFRSAVFGMNLGLGMHIGIFSLDCHYEFGVSDISPTINNKVNVLTINAGLRFRL
ncbi:MAG: outer membrane beta-barrel protein [Bacteroidales bacterium]|nr:outer membrane beta-barrel protein [Bacteroidales bacterium]HOY38688.1 outer membrane beta-barrel protein [Bacteroidales bacterium]HQP03777.1 outer membrane beta-barrel protein [Bacteroidales bacterium]